MIPRKIIHRLRGYIVFLLYKLIFGSRLMFRTLPSVRKNLNIMIGDKGKLKIGSGCFFNNNCSLDSLGNIEIGNDCLFGENVCVYDHNHLFSNPSALIKDQGYEIGEVIVGNNCWLGSNVTLLKGANIGDNCVIGAGCVISCEIPADSIVTNYRNLKIRPINYGGREA